MIIIRDGFVIMKLREIFNGHSKQDIMDYLLPKFLANKLKFFEFP